MGKYKGRLACYCDYLVVLYCRKFLSLGGERLSAP